MVEVLEVSLIVCSTTEGEVSRYRTCGQGHHREEESCRAIRVYDAFGHHPQSVSEGRSQLFRLKATTAANTMATEKATRNRASTDSG